MNNKATKSEIEDCSLERAVDLLEGLESMPSDKLETAISEPWDRRAVSLVIAGMEAVRAAAVPSPDVEKEWSQFVSAHNVVEESASNDRRRPMTVIFRVLLAAAAVAALVVMFLPKAEQAKTSAYIYETSKASRVVKVSSPADVKVVNSEEIVCKAHAVKDNTIEVPEGKQLKVTLPDGTIAWVNCGSTLSYSSSFGNGVREVRLQGEACFKVRHDALHPFVVKAGDITVHDIGTTFNVRSYADQPQHVTLVEGSAEVQNNGRAVRLQPGEDASVSERQLKVARVDTEDYTSWRNGIIPFNESDLHAVALYLCKWYGLNLICGDSALLNEKVHFVFDRSASRDQAVEMLNDIATSSISVEGNTLYIKKVKR